MDAQEPLQDNLNEKLKLIVICGAATSNASGQTISVFLHSLEKVPLTTFESCGDAEASAKELSQAIPDHVYLMELFPSNQRSLFVLFLTDAGGYLRQALQYSYRSEAPPPRGILYFVKGRYEFRCRDNHGHFVESNGPDGNPLRLGITPGEAEIWHFAITQKGLHTCLSLPICH